MTIRNLMGWAAFGLALGVATPLACSGEGNASTLFGDPTGSTSASSSGAGGGGGHRDPTGSTSASTSATASATGAGGADACVPVQCLSCRDALWKTEDGGTVDSSELCTEGGADFQWKLYEQCYCKTCAGSSCIGKEGCALDWPPAAPSCVECVKNVCMSERQACAQNAVPNNGCP